MDPAKNMIRPHTGPIRRQTDVWVLSAIAALNCWVVPLAFAFSELSIPYRTMGDIFPFPAVYFIEIVGLGIAGLFSVYYTDPGRNSRVRTAPTQGIFSTGEDAPANRPGILSRRSFWAAVPWVCAGITLTFVILGSATIGLYLLPAFFSFLILGIVIDRKEKGDIPLHFICFISAGIAQSLLVYLFVLSSL